MARAVELAQNMEAAHKNSQAMKASSLPLGKIERLSKEKQCYHCGSVGHAGYECRFRDTLCHQCGKKGHLARVCRGSSRQGGGEVVTLGG